MNLVMISLNLVMISLTGLAGGLKPAFYPPPPLFFLYIHQYMAIAYSKMVLKIKGCFGLVHSASKLSSVSMINAV